MTEAVHDLDREERAELGAPGVLVRLVPAGVALALVLCGIGWVIVNELTPSPLTEWEREVNLGWALARSDGLNTATSIGSRLSDTITCIAILLVMALLLRWWLGRWRESWTLVAAITGELLVFLAVTAVVNRERPDVPRLDLAPPTSSFPSGHTAAAVALYGCLAVIIWRNLERRRLAALLVVLCTLVPVVVGLSRIYRGMHHPSDVVLGALGGGAWLLVVLLVMLPRDSGAPPAPPGDDRMVTTEPHDDRAESVGRS